MFYKVNDNNTTHITQSQLARQFIGSSQIDIQCVSLLSVTGFGTVTAIDIHHMKRFSVFNNQVSSTLIRNRFTE